ncbi:MAG: 5-formyltetrahydrofolate cyclo-ligase [Actinomycetota bacterium]|nr:5-formyltetrahydrofolate cyclo-ligase [Actinomycetota bacterium]
MAGGGRRHDQYAGGDASVLAAKAALRDEVWSQMRGTKVARFPGAEGRIPNFVGAEAAAERLRGTDEWERAATVKANPDSPQLPVRQRALEDGKTVFMAAPRLAADKPFLVLDPASLPVPARQAASIKGASRHGRAVDVADLDPVDLAVVGCVAVSSDGARLGKGGGFSDLEYAIAWEAGLVRESTVVVTTVHEAQVVDRGRIPVTAHDFALDLIVTPERVVDCRRAGEGRRKSPGIRWDELTEEKVASIPVLGRLRSHSR